MHTFLVHYDGYESGSNRFAKDHFNFSSYKVVGIQKGEHNNKHSRWQLGMNNRRDYEQMSIA